MSEDSAPSPATALRAPGLQVSILHLSTVSRLAPSASLMAAPTSSSSSSSAPPYTLSQGPSHGRGRVDRRSSDSRAAALVAVVATVAAANWLDNGRGGSGDSADADAILTTNRHSVLRDRNQGRGAGGRGSRATNRRLRRPLLLQASVLAAGRNPGTPRDPSLCRS